MPDNLLKNIPNMANFELIGLAKNRWLPEEYQIAIAKTGYRRAQSYLTSNSALTPKVVEYLWSDECNRGYSLKTELIMYGHMREKPEKYWELYLNHPSAWSRSTYRMTHALLGASHWVHGNANCAKSGTPSDLLNRIYDEHFAPRLRTDISPYGTYGSYTLKKLVNHPNVDLPLAIKLSVCGVNDVQKLAFDKIVHLS